ncbi:MAG TPA: ABC transporter ATP-binding protein, partial [Sphingomicrobium sp.]|nr:ABC transporter ATP-binding protein [Sphingomicrobium sp.]
DYEGTVLIVSHDRDFLDRTVTVTLGLDGSGKVDIVAGGYEDWAKRRSSRAPAKAGAQTRAAPKEDRTGPLLSQGNKKLSYKDQRDLDRLPGEIERFEAEIAAVEDVLADPDLYTRDPKRFAELTEMAGRLRSEKHAAEQRWLEVAEAAEQLAAS